MAMPEIDEENRKKPLCYNPINGRFIYYDDIVNKKEPIILPSTLSKSDQKELILMRQLKGRDYRTQTISGPLMTRDDIVRSIRYNEEEGMVLIEAEISYLDELLEQIRQNLK
jgi:hypothetical protein